jgi:hypothetical protein
VSHRKDARRGDHLVEVLAQQEFSKESLLRSVGPVSTAECSDEEGAEQGEAGKICGSVAS